MPRDNLSAADEAKLHAMFDNLVTAWEAKQDIEALTVPLVEWGVDYANSLRPRHGLLDPVIGHLSPASTQRFFEGAGELGAPREILRVIGLWGGELEVQRLAEGIEAGHLPREWAIRALCAIGGLRSALVACARRTKSFSLPYADASILARSMTFTAF